MLGLVAGGAHRRVGLGHSVLEIGADPRHREHLFRGRGRGRGSGRGRGRGWARGRGRLGFRTYG